jgi:hypothetical protein
MSQIMLTMFVVDLVSFRCKHNLGLNYAKRNARSASPHPRVPMDISIIQPHFMPLLSTLQRGSTQLSIIQPHFMPLLSTLQRGSTQLSIIYPHFMFVQSSLREISSLTINIYLV